MDNGSVFDDLLVLNTIVDFMALPDMRLFMCSRDMWLRGFPAAQVRIFQSRLQNPLSLKGSSVDVCETAIRVIVENFRLVMSHIARLGSPASTITSASILAHIEEVEETLAYSPPSAQAAIQTWLPRVDGGVGNHLRSSLQCRLDELEKNQNIKKVH